MNKIINVPLPLNMADEDSLHYVPYSSYMISSQRVKYFRNVFITSSGLAINNKGLIRQCYHAYTHHQHVHLENSSNEVSRAKNDESRILELKKEVTYLLIHHPWYNYYHWICESIFRLWMARKKTDSYILLLPEKYKNVDFIQESIAPFKVNQTYYIPSGKNVFVRNLCLPEIKPICDSYNILQVKQVRAFYQKYVESAKDTSGKYRKLYVSRKLAGRRNVVNDDEVIGILKSYGFEILFPERHSFLEQVAIFTSVEILVGEHGSGLTNMLFMNRGTSLLELHKNRTNELEHPSFLFWYLANALEINYYHQPCADYGKVDYFEGQYIIDTTLLRINLELILKSCGHHYEG